MIRYTNVLKTTLRCLLKVHNLDTIDTCYVWGIFPTTYSKITLDNIIYVCLSLHITDRERERER